MILALALLGWVLSGLFGCLLGRLVYFRQPMEFGFWFNGAVCGPIAIAIALFFIAKELFSLIEI